MSTQSSLIEPVETQFEPDGDAFLYRRYPEDAPVRVSAAEHDAYVEDHRRSIGRLVVGLLLLLLLGGAGAITLYGGLGADWAFLPLAAVAMIVLFSGWATYRVARARHRRTGHLRRLAGCASRRRRATSRFRGCAIGSWR